MDRPSFAHGDNDAISMQSMDRSTSSKNGGQPEYLGDADMKNPKGPGFVAEEYPVPAYEEEVGEVRPVEDAKDLVSLLHPVSALKAPY